MSCESLSSLLLFLQGRVIRMGRRWNLFFDQVASMLSWFKRGTILVAMMKMIREYTMIMFVYLPKFGWFNPWVFCDKLKISPRKQQRWDVSVGYQRLTMGSPCFFFNHQLMFGEILDQTWSRHFNSDSSSDVFVWTITILVKSQWVKSHHTYLDSMSWLIPSPVHIEHPNCMVPMIWNFPTSTMVSFRGCLIWRGEGIRNVSSCHGS